MTTAAGRPLRPGQPVIERASPTDRAFLAITSAVPAGVGPGGNIPVYFEVLSHAGTLTITATVDPGHFPDPSSLTAALRAELGLIIRHPPARR